MYEELQFEEINAFTERQFNPPWNGAIFRVYCSDGVKRYFSGFSEELTWQCQHCNTILVDKDGYEFLSAHVCILPEMDPILKDLRLEREKAIELDARKYLGMSVEALKAHSKRKS